MNNSAAVRQGLFIAAATTASCSRVRLTYPWLDWVLEGQAERYLDLDDQQERMLEGLADDYVGWHRRVMFPRYASYLRGLAGNARAGFGQAQAAAAVRSCWLKKKTTASRVSNARTANASLRHPTTRNQTQTKELNAKKKTTASRVNNARMVNALQ